MEKYDAVIIGAGVSGLVCGCYLAKAGLKVLIIEQRDKPGGYCSSFQRGNYKFDAGVHYLGGIKKGLLGAILSELELNNIRFNQLDPTDKIVMPDNTVYIRTDPCGTIEEFKDNFPAEKQAIEKFFKFVIQENFLTIYSKTKKITFKQVIDKYFADERLKATLCMLLWNVGLPASKITAATALMLFREFILDPGYYPEGGMQGFPDALMDRFRACGGELMLSRKAEKIITEGNKVKGVITGNDKIMSDAVISNADATETFRKLLDKQKTRESTIIKKLHASASVFSLYLGLKVGLKDILPECCNIWYSTTYKLEEFFNSLCKNILKPELPGLMIAFPLSNPYNCITSLITAPYASGKFWDNQRGAMAQKMIRIIKKFIPSIENYIDTAITATPNTFQRYTSNRNGAIYGWAPTVKQTISSLLPQETSINGLFLTGHWCTKGIGAGCVSGVASLGRNAAKIVLANKGREWGYPLFFR